MKTMENFSQPKTNRLNSKLFCLFIGLLISVSGFSQNVAINASGNPPNASAGLDVDFPNKGLLIPRIALTGTVGFAPLSGHVAGMIVYNTATVSDVVPGFYYDDGTKWIAGFPSGIAVGNMLYWNGTNWVLVPAGLPGQYLQLSGSNLPVWGGLIVASPNITTAAASLITGTSASSGALISSDGGSPIVTRGICYNILTNPTIANTKVTDPSGGIGLYSSNLTGLLPVTTYYIRAFAINSTSVNYGNEINFTTLAILPTITTFAANSITGSSAISGGNVTSTGGSPIIERGICYATTANPTILNTKVVNPAPGAGIFSSNLTGLTGSTIYYVRAYATNSVGIAYGAQISFTTLIVPPTLVTAAATNIAGAVVTSGASMSWNGGGYSNYQNYGVAYSTLPNAGTPTRFPTNTNNGSVNPAVPIAPWVTNITGLVANTTYYIRSYLDLYQSGLGWVTVFGNELTFTTSAPSAPIVGSTAVITGISDRTGNSGGTITTDGGSPITVKGVCWSTSTNPTLGAGNFTTNGTGTTSFVSNITGLTGSTLYYVRAYATNSIGTSYSPASVSFTTWVSAPFSIGQNTGYGFCAYVAPDGTGFIISYDIPSTAPWGCSGTLIATSPLLGTGLANTNAILAACATRPIGASVAKNHTGGGFNDWYLPSNGEWALIAARYTLFGFSGSYTNYLTSTASSLTSGGSYFYTGSQAYFLGSARTGGDAYATKIRAIRSFSAISLPVITTTTISNILINTATGGGNVTNEGGAPVSARGVCWSTTTGPTVGLLTKTVDGTGLGAFVSSITGLASGTTYYVRAYATNSGGTTYGSELTFATNVPILTPTVTTDLMGSLVGSIAEGNYTVVNEGATAVTDAGIVWGTTAGATIATNTGIAIDPIWSTAMTGISLPLDMTNLTVNTIYFVRAFATNGNGTGYGADVSFTATAATLGQVTWLNWQGGVVYSVNSGGAHGLIALNFNSGQPADWGCPNALVGTTNTIAGTGNANTDAILANITTNVCISGAPAVLFAAQMSKAGPEWYLPSKDEFNLLWTTVNADQTLYADLIFGLPLFPYWSSSEVDATQAWYFDGTTWLNTGVKTAQYNVWPIRTF